MYIYIYICYKYKYHEIKEFPRGKREEMSWRKIEREKKKEQRNTR